EKLKSFKEKVYPEGLIENYRRVIEFRDKFARQLELKVRDLQRYEAKGSVPLSLEFFSVEAADSVGSHPKQVIEYPEVTDFDRVPQSAKASLLKKIKEITYCPIVLAVRNVSPSGIRNIFAEIRLQADDPSLELIDASPGRSQSQSQPWSSVWSTF